MLNSSELAIFRRNPGQLELMVDDDSFSLYALMSKRLMEPNQRVGWLYRESPDRAGDSGWRVFVGDEDDSYIENPDNIALVSLEGLLELDPQLKKVLASRVGSEIEREDESELFRDLETGIEVVEPYISEDWTFAVDSDFQCRFENGSLVYWRPGHTLYIDVFDCEPGEEITAIEAMLADRVREPKETYDIDEDDLISHAYLLPEDDDGRTYWGLNTLTASRGSVLAVSFYFDDENDKEWALNMWKTIKRLDDPPDWDPDGDQEESEA